MSRFQFTSIRLRLNLWILLAAVLPLILASGLVFRQVRSIEERQIQKLVGIRDSRVREINGWLAEREGDIQIAADAPMLSEYLSEVEQHGATSGGTQLVAQVRELLSSYITNYEDYIELFIINRSSGIVTVSTSPDREGVDKSDDLYFTEAIRRGKSFFKDIYRSKSMDGKPSMSISNAIRCQEHGGIHILGVIVARIDLNRSVYKTLLDRTDMGYSGETLIVNRQGLTLNALRHHEDAPLNLRITTLPATRAIAGESGIILGVDYRNEPILAAYAFIPKMQWGFVVKQDVKEIYAPIRDLLRDIFYLLALTAVVIIPLSWFLARTLSQPVLDMIDVTEAIMEGDYSHKVHFTRSDEFGALGRAIDDMAEKRQQAELELEAHRAQLQYILDTGPVGIAFSTQGIVQFANPKFIEMFDATVGEPSPNLYVNPEERDELIAKLESEGKVENYELQMYGREGQIRDMLITYLPINYEGEDGILGWLTDITTRKQAEIALAEAKEHLDLAMSAAGMGNWIYHVLEDRFETDAATERIFGMAPGEFDGKFASWVEFIHPDDLERVTNRMEISRTSGKNYEDEYRIILKSGDVRHVSGRGVFILNAEGIAERGTGLIWDITESKQAEDKIKKLSVVTEQSPISVIITDLKGRIEYINPKYTEVTGYSSDEVIGKSSKILSSGNQPKEFYKDLWDTILSGKEWHGEFCNKKKNGDIFWESESISPLTNTAGDVTHFVALKEDITDQRQAKEELQHANFMSDNALDLAKAGFWHIDLSDPEYYTSSERAVAIFGDPPSAGHRYKLMEHWGECVKAGDAEAAERTFANYAAAVAGEVPRYDAVYAYKRPIDGEVVWIHAIGDVVRDADGKATDMFGVTQDITDQILAENDLKQKLDELERFNRLVVGREIRMIDLKKEVNELLGQTGVDEKYKIVSVEDSDDILINDG